MTPGLRLSRMERKKAEMKKAKQEVTISILTSARTIAAHFVMKTFFVYRHVTETIIDSGWRQTIVFSVVFAVFVFI